MKKLIIFPIYFFITLAAFCQSLEKDNLLGLHVIDVKLNPGVTMDQFKSFFVNEVLPVYEKQWIGLKGHLVKSVRGEYKDKFAIIWVFANEPTRDFYFNETGPNQRELDALDKVKPIEAKLKEKYGTYTVHYQDDWVVQK